MDSKLYEEIGKAVELAEKDPNADLTSKNLRYVVKVAMDLSQQSGFDFYDLFVEGVIGMKQAELKYDPKENDSFTKYAAMSVRGPMLNMINRQGNLVHIPVNHMKGFKKGQESLEETKITYEHIDATNYDTLGMCDNEAFNYDRMTILRNGLNTLDETARTIMKMKLKLDEYEDIDSISFKSIADKLDITSAIAKRIYEESLVKLSKYCQAESE